jgi:hypothetical protein
MKLLRVHLKFRNTSDARQEDFIPIPLLLNPKFQKNADAIAV